MIDAAALARVDAVFEPIVVIVDSSQLAAAREVWAAAGLSVHVVEGRKATSAATLFDAFQFAFEFPSYFGRNWDALNDCIADLAWLDVGSGIVLVVTDPSELLRETASPDFAALVKVLAVAAEQWASPAAKGEWWDRPPVPFHVVLACEQANLARVTERWTEGGATLCFDRAAET